MYLHLVNCKCFALYIYIYKYNSCVGYIDGIEDEREANPIEDDYSF